MKKIFFACIMLTLSTQTQEPSTIKKELSEKPERSAQSKLDSLEVTRTNGVLIFLDDSERGYMRALSYEALAGLLSEAGPIILPRSLLANLKKTEQPREKDDKELFKMYQSLPRADPYSRTIVLSIKAFDDVADHWIIKEASPEMYLLLPKKMASSLNLSVESIEAYTPNGITQTEQMLGLKVNHMKTVGLNDVTMPQEEHEDSDYLIGSLPSIFVSNSEYTGEYKREIPAWALYISGHGGINSSIAGLSLHSFKQLLLFLDKKITTKLLLYSSCYTGGVNKETIYKDLESEIEKVYPFTIIAQGLSDTTTSGIALRIELKEEKLNLDKRDMYNQFFDMVVSQDSIDYEALIQHFLPPFDSIGSLAQIKYAQLPWFSVLDTEKVVSVSSIMAKTRTKPLDIATFFGKKKSEPIGILLYAQYVPFTLIINTEKMPGFVSMVPGSAVHRIKKISAKNHALYTIFNSLTPRSNNIFRKIFFIEQLYCRLTDNDKPETFTNVIIDHQENKAELYLTREDDSRMYRSNSEDLSEITDQEKDKRYDDLLQMVGNPEPEWREERLNQIRSQLKNNTFTAAEAEPIIKDILDIMPDNSALHIPTIKSAAHEEQTEWRKMLINFQEHTSPLGSQKLLWIGGIQFCKTADNCYYPYTNIIIEKTKYGWFRVLFAESVEDREYLVSLHQGAWDYLPESYVPEYEKIWDYYEEHGELPIDTEKKIENIEKRSIHKLITQEHVKKLKDIQEKKIEQQKEQAQKQKEETKSSSLLQKKRAVYGNAPEGYGRHRMKERLG